MNNCHIYISAAAISDYRVENIATQKIKKTEETLTLQLTKNDDIISAVAEHKTRPYVVGFAAETENLIENAKQKLRTKNLDMIVANDVSESPDAAAGTGQNIGFNSEYNALHVFWSQGNDDLSSRYGEQHFDIGRKSLLAKQLISLIAKQYKINNSQNAKNTA